MRRSRGIALLAFLAALVVVGLAFFIGNLTPQAIEARRAQNTDEALARAREALIGYALRFREHQTAQGQPNWVYGFLPLPDLGHNPSNWTDRNNNPSCQAEGCDAANFAGNALNATVIGRLPWRALGIEPLRDGSGECLWYAVAGSHQRIMPGTPMNWDTLSHLDVVVANGGAALAAALASAHERPVAVIFAAGPPLSGQNRSTDATYDVTQCGGNYDARNYLDPHTATALGGVTNYLAGTNNASAVTDPNAPKPLSLQGRVFASGGNFLPNACTGGDCDLVANDVGLSLTGDALFGAIRKNANFRTDINSMLDRMTFCLQDQIAAGGAFAPVPITGFAPADKSAGRIPGDACYADGVAPQGYFSHYRDLVFVAKPNTGNFTVNGDPNCAGLLLFAGQRGPGQARINTGDRDTLSNYLEGDNSPDYNNIHDNFGNGTNFTGPTQFNSVRASKANPQDVARCVSGGIWSAIPDCQLPEQDIVRCIPAGATFTTVTSPALEALGFGQLVAYDPGTRTLTLGRENVTTTFGAEGSALYGCAWVSQTRTLGGGVRVYFTFQFKRVGTTVGLNGFVFALADATRNTLASCGAAGSHLGYSGVNPVSPKIDYPKIGIEFDQSRNTGFSETDINVANPGRNDPDGTVTYGYNSHVAILYWGHAAANLTDNVTLPDYDDNVHGFPTAASLAGVPRPPRNPDAAPGLDFKNLRGQAALAGDSFLYHVRVEVTPTARNVDAADARLSNTVMQTEAWIQASPGSDQLAALKDTTRPMSLLYPTYLSTLKDTATLYDVSGNACDVGNPCPSGQACGPDGFCYRPAMHTVQLGFTGSQRTTDQQVNITDFFATWLP